MNIKINDIIIKDRIRRDLGDITELAQDIKANGLINPPVITPKHELIAGERRLAALKQNGETTVDAIVMEIRDAEHMLNLEISENETRKDFSKSERIEYARRLERIESLKADQRMKDPTQNSAEGETREIVAKAIGVSHDTLAKEKAIVDNKDLLDPTDFAEWDEGKLSTNKAYIRMKHELDKMKADLVIAQNENTALKNRPVKEVVKEVIPGDYEALKSMASGYKADFERSQQERDKFAKELSELREKQAAMIASTPEEKVYERLKKDTIYFCAGISKFLKEYGGYAYLTDEIGKLPDTERKGYYSAIHAIYDWANEMLNTTVQEDIR